MVSIEDFLKMDIRVGRISGAEDIEKARGPMYKLTVELGSGIGTRTIVAGIKEKYTKDELIGKKIVCIVNLDPKTIAGVESHGMLLAAGDEEVVSVLVPERETEEGTKVH